jgi:hypothetical protein
LGLGQPDLEIAPHAEANYPEKHLSPYPAKRQCYFWLGGHAPTAKDLILRTNPFGESNLGPDRSAGVSPAIAEGTTRTPSGNWN